MHAMTTRQILAAAALVAGCLVHTAGSLAAQTPVPDADPAIEKLVASVSEERLQQLLEKLVSFGTRNTMSDPTSTTRGIGAARQWIFDELKRSSPRLQVSFDTHMLKASGRITQDVELRNVIAVLPGKSPRRIYVSGHYDSLNLGARGQAGLNTGAGRQGGAQGQPGAQRAFDRLDRVAGKRLPRTNQMLATATHLQWIDRILGNLRQLFATEGRRDDLAAMTELAQALETVQRKAG